MLQVFRIENVAACLPRCRHDQCVIDVQVVPMSDLNGRFVRLDGDRNDWFEETLDCVQCLSNMIPIQSCLPSAHLHKFIQHLHTDHSAACDDLVSTHPARIRWCALHSGGGIH